MRSSYSRRGNFFAGDLGGVTCCRDSWLNCSCGLSTVSEHLAEQTVFDITAMFSNWTKTLWTLFLLASAVQAQFQFFEQMFGGVGGPGQGRQQQAAQDEPSDPSWYQKNWENGEIGSVLIGLSQVLYKREGRRVVANRSFRDYSTLLKISMPRNSRLRTFPASLSLSASRC